MAHYGTTGDADTFHSEQGNTSWAALSAGDKTAALTRASDYVDSLGTYRTATGRMINRFAGTKVGGRSQAPAWPRKDGVDLSGEAIDHASVPIEVMKATYIAALYEATSPGSLAPSASAAGNVKRKKTDVLEKEFFEPARMKDGSIDTRVELPIVVDVMAPLMTGGALGGSSAAVSGIVV